MIMSCPATSASSSHLLNTLFSRKGFAKALSSAHVTPPPPAKLHFNLPQWTSPAPAPAPRGGGTHDFNRRRMKEQLRDAVGYFDEMVRMGYAPHRDQATALLYHLCVCNRVDLAVRVLELTASATGRPLDDGELTHVVSQLCSRGKVGHAMQLIDKMETLFGLEASNQTYETLAQGYSLHGSLSQSLQFMERMLRRGKVPKEYTFSSLLEAVSNERGVAEAERLLEEILAKGGQPDVVDFNIILKGLCEENRLDDALRLFRSLPAKGIQPNSSSYNIFLRRLLDLGRWGDAENLLAEMRSSSCSANWITYNILIDSLSVHGLTGHALEVLDEMERNGFRPRPSSYNPIIARFCKLGDVAAAKVCLHSMLYKHRYVPTSGTHNAVALLCDNPPGLVHEAFEILQMLCNHRGEDCSVHNFYNKFVDHLCNWGNTFAAFQLLPKMVPAVFTPTLITYSYLLGGLCSEGMLDKAIEIIQIMEKEGVFTYRKNYNALIARLCKTRRMDLAIEVYVTMVKKGVMPNESTYGMLVEGIARWHEVQLAAKVLRELHRRDVVTRNTVERIATQYNLFRSTERTLGSAEGWQTSFNEIVSM